MPPANITPQYFMDMATDKEKKKQKREEKNKTKETRWGWNGRDRRWEILHMAAPEYLVRTICHRKKEPEMPKKMIPKAQKSTPMAKRRWFMVFTSPVRRQPPFQPLPNLLREKLFFKKMIFRMQLKKYPHQEALFDEDPRLGLCCNCRLNSFCC